MYYILYEGLKIESVYSVHNIKIGHISYNANYKYII